jgi:DNA-binding transcriptional ArsR family regulator
MRWIYTLPEPKDAQTALAALKAIPAEERLSVLTFTGCEDAESSEFHIFLQSLTGKQRLTAKIEQQIQAYYASSDKATKPFIRATFAAWADPAAFGETLYQALEAYVQNFFLEEEARILPAQQAALAEVQQRVEQEDLRTILEDVSGGVRMDWIEDVGELVPEDLLNALKALADPTRLRILRTLLEAPSTPSDLAKSLRLRPPTVIHHLHILRLAGLVLVTVAPKAERRYAIRKDGLAATSSSLQDFLSGD